MDTTGTNDTASIAVHVRGCLTDFQNVINSMNKAEPAIKSKLPPGAVDDELGRFTIWSGNVGAHRKGRGSLDYKLREASHIQDRVTELLQNLRLVLRDAMDIINGEREPWEDFSDSGSDSSEDEFMLSKMPTTTELEQLVSNMTEINTCLMRLSIAIRNPAPHDQFKDSTHIDVTHFEAFDIKHVRGKFPMAKEYLVARLGKAISRRRQYLRYREEHRKRLEQGLEKHLELSEVILPQAISHNSAAPSEYERAQSTIASSLPSIVKVSASATGFDEMSFHEDALSQTSYASSNQESARLRPPPLPEQGQDGSPFECPLCFRFTSVQQTAAWYKHVYQDLQPYMCTSEECEVSDRTYETRHEWFNHELRNHRSQSWECLDGCNQSFISVDSFRNHLWRKHSGLTNEQRIEDLVRSCERSADLVTEAECPLCAARFPSLNVLKPHLAKHQEEISLFALPSYLKDNREDSDISQQEDVPNCLPVSEEGKGTTTRAETVTLTACFCTSANILALPGLGKIKLIPDRLQYEHIDESLRWEIPFAEINSCIEFTFRTIKILGPMYDSRNGLSEIENGGGILIEFLTAKDKDTAYSHIRTCVAKLHDEATATKVTGMPAARDPRFLPDIMVQGISTETVQAHVKFGVNSIFLYDLNSSDFWHILGGDIEGCTVAGDSAGITTSMIFERGRAFPEFRSLLLTPRNAAKLSNITYYTRALIMMQSNGPPSSFLMPDMGFYPLTNPLAQGAPEQMGEAAPSDSKKPSQNKTEGIDQQSASGPELIGPNPTFLGAAAGPQNLLSRARFRVVIHTPNQEGDTQVGDVQFFKTLFTVTLELTGEVCYYIRVYSVKMMGDSILQLVTSMYTSDAQPRQQIHNAFYFRNAWQARLAEQLFEAYIESASTIPLRLAS